MGNPLLIQGPGEPFEASGSLLIILLSLLLLAAVVVGVVLLLWMKLRRARSADKFDA